MGSKLRRVVESGRQWETAGVRVADTGVFRASTREQETLGAIGSRQKSSKVAAVYSVYTPCTTNLRHTQITGLWEKELYRTTVALGARVEHGGMDLTRTRARQCMAH